MFPPGLLSAYPRWTMQITFYKPFIICRIFHMFLGSPPSFLHILLKGRSKNKTEYSCSGLTNSPSKDISPSFHLTVPSWWVHVLPVIVLHCCFHALQSSSNVFRSLHPRNETFNSHAGFLIFIWSNSSACWSGKPRPHSSLWSCSLSLWTAASLTQFISW